MATYEEIKKANDSIVSTPIKGKDYAEVNQRIKAFRMVYPMGFIRTFCVDDAGGRCVFRAEVGCYEDGMEIILGQGTAYEKEGSTFINKTSYIENCETSAVGRALGMAGFGIEKSVASAEEVQNAIANQNAPEQNTPEPKKDGVSEKKATPKQIEFLKNTYEGENMEKLLKANNLSKIEDMPMKKASDLISKIKGAK